MWRSSCTLLKQSASRHKPPSPPRLLAAARVSPSPTSFSAAAGVSAGEEERSITSGEARKQIHTPIHTYTYRYICRERMCRPSPPLGLRLLPVAASVPPSLATFSSSSVAGKVVGGGEERAISSGEARNQIHTHTYRYIYRERMQRPSPPLGLRRSHARVPPYPATFSSAAGDGEVAGGGGGEERGISLGEARKLMRLVNVEALKKKLGTEGKEVIGYPELLEACVGMGVAKSREEAVAFVRVLDDAAVVLVFGDKVYLHPDKVVDLVRKAVPLALTPEDDPRREELKSLLDKKEELDKLAYKQVRRILWTGLGFGILQTGLFFRLTFWEFSWDVMEPIAFFTTATGIVIGYAYFLFTSRDPTYQDFMQRLFLSRQRKLIKKYNFDFNRYMELQKKCKCPLDGHKVSNHQVGVDVEHDSHNDAFH